MITTLIILDQLLIESGSPISKPWSCLGKLRVVLGLVSGGPGGSRSVDSGCLGKSWEILGAHGGSWGDPEGAPGTHLGPGSSLSVAFSKEMEGELELIEG